MGYSMNARKLTRSQLRPLGLRMLQAQGGVCSLCGKPIDLTIKGELVIDHDHDTGLIRGALHRSCNAAEGKVANAAGRWGAKSMSYEAIIPWLQNLLAYLQKDKQPFIYPSRAQIRNQEGLTMSAIVESNIRLHPLHSPEWVANYVLSTGQYPGPRNTGRTTILALRMIAAAMENPRVKIQALDHFGSVASNRDLADAAASIIRAAGLYHFKCYTDCIQFG